MRHVWLAALAVAIPVSLAADWKGDLAKKAVGRAVGHAVREGLQDAIADAALDVALDVAVPSALEQSSQTEVVANSIEVAENVTDAIEVGMQVANVGETLNDVANAARTVQKISKIGKLRRSVGLTISADSIAAPSPTSVRSAKNTSTADIETYLPMTCVQAWTTSGRGYTCVVSPARHDDVEQTRFRRL